VADPVRTSLLAQVNSADTFGTGNYTPAGTFNLTAGKPVIIIAYGIGETDNGMRGTSLTATLSAGPTPERIIASNASSGWSYGVAAWRVLPIADASSVSVTIGSAGLDAHSYSVAVDQWDNVDPKQIIGEVINGSTATGDAATITFQRPPRRSSVVVGAACTAATSGNLTAAPGADFTEIADTNSAGWAGYEYQTRGSSVSREISWADLDVTGVAFGAALIAFEIRGLEFAATTIHWPTQWDWKPQRWDFPLNADLLLDDFLPGGGSGGTTYQQSVDGVLSFSGIIQKQTNKQLVGGLSFAGTMQKQTNKVLAGVLSFAGALQKQTNKLFSGSLSFNGALAAQAVFTSALAGVLSFAGALQKQTNKQLAGALSFSGLMQRQTNKMLLGVLSFTGIITRSYIVQALVSGVLSFAGALATVFTPGGGGPVRYFIKKRARRDHRNL
jgi:hypothetical protein